MGMFDSYLAACPCGHSVEFQTKAGACVLASYSQDNPPPPDVRAGLLGRSEQCTRCGRTVTLQPPVSPVIQEVWVR